MISYIHKYTIIIKLYLSMCVNVHYLYYEFVKLEWLKNTIS